MTEKRDQNKRHNMCNEFAHCSPPYLPYSAIPMPVLAVKTQPRKLSTCKEKLLRLESMRVMNRKRGAAFLLRRYSKFTTGLLTAATTASVLNDVLKLSSPFR